MYKLSASMSDRINFDELCVRYIDDLRRAEGFDRTYRDQYCEQFLNGVEVDDAEEARARFLHIFDRVGRGI